LHILRPCAYTYTRRIHLPLFMLMPCNLTLIFLLQKEKHESEKGNGTRRSRRSKSGIIRYGVPLMTVSDLCSSDVCCASFHFADFVSNSQNFYLFFLRVRIFVLFSYISSVFP
jgi:hypothetical protein